MELHKEASSSGRGALELNELINMSLRESVPG